MKRWMFIIVIGILLACYGIAEILVLKEISFKEVGKIIVIFIVGFLAIITGLVGLNKRTLEVLVESTDDRMENKKRRDYPIYRKCRQTSRHLQVL